MPRAVPLPKSIVRHQSKKCLLFSRGALVRRLRVCLYHQVALVTARVNALGEEGGLPGGGGARSHSLQVQASVQSAVEAATRGQDLQLQYLRGEVGTVVFAQPLFRQHTHTVPRVLTGNMRLFCSPSTAVCCLLAPV